jgi:hypothetical protein
VWVGGRGGGAFVLETISAELLHSVCDYIQKLQNCWPQFLFSYQICLFNLNRNTPSPSLAGYITGCVLENRGSLQILLTREKGRGAICHSTGSYCAPLASFAGEGVEGPVSGGQRGLKTKRPRLPRNLSIRVQ